MPRWQHSLFALLFLLPTLSFVWADESAPQTLPDSAPGRILEGWPSAHNAADPAALQAWMESAYGPKLVVHLRSTEVASDPSPDPAKVLVVEIDMDPEDLGHLSWGLGLGPLVCEAPRRH